MRSRDDALRWKKAHPWLWGFFYGLASGEFVAVATFLGGDGTAAEALTLGVFFGLVIWLVASLSVKRGWFERMDDPGPTVAEPGRRTGLWSRASDGGLRWAVFWGVVVVLTVTYGLLATENNPWIHLFILAVSAPQTITAWMELQRRKRASGPHQPSRY